MAKQKITVARGTKQEHLTETEKIFKILKNGAYCASQ